MSDPQRVLVVENDDSIRELIALALGDEGYEVSTAADGAIGLQIATASPPSLILLDMCMPVMDGWTFARMYRDCPGPHAPIVVLTAGREAARAAHDIQAAGYLAKPFELARLFAVVARYTATS
jgi:CheY-like chemotaxis protein